MICWCLFPFGYPKGNECFRRIEETIWLKQRLVAVVPDCLYVYSTTRVAASIFFNIRFRNIAGFVSVSTKGTRLSTVITTFLN